jgi:hypothetical protein
VEGPAVVELAWLAKFKLNVWTAASFNCSSQVRNRISLAKDRD